MMRSFHWCLVAAILVIPWPALANREPDTTYDARSAGMGGTGAASAAASGAAYHNTALLDGVEKLSLVLTFSPFFPQPSGPWPDPMTFQPVTRTASRRLAPLFMAQAAYRVHERVVVGVAAFAAGGGGALYEDVPILGGNDADVSAFIMEVQIPVSFRISEELSFGAAYRFAYGQADISVAQLVDPMDPSMGFVVPTTHFSGTMPAAVQLGLRYRPTPQLQFGIGYRQKLSVDIEGETKIGDNVVASGIKSNLSEPHRFVAGGAAHLLEDKLTLALDLTYWLYSESHKANPAENRAASWNDAFSMGVGGEYLLSPTIPVRVGYALGKMATVDAAASPFEPAPGLRHTFTLGSGLRLGRMAVDLAGAYAVIPDKEITTGMNAGTYSTKSLLFSLTASYQY